MFEVEARIQGIPCIIQVTEYQEGSFSYNAASDIDYYGCIEYNICDRKGYAAAWLERKVTPKDEDNILEAIEEHIREQNRRIVEDQFYFG